MPFAVRLLAVKVGRYALAIMLFGTAAINSALAKELTPPSGQTGAAVVSGHGQGASGRGAAAQINAGTKGNADARSGNRVGTTGDSGGIKGEPHGVPNPGGGAGTKGMSDGGAQAGTQHNGTGANPIDTSITVQSPSKSESAVQSRDWNKAKIAVPSGNFSEHRSTSSSSTKDRVTRNAIGVLMPPREAAKGPDAGGRGFAPPSVDGTARSTAGALRNLPSVGRPDTGRQISSPAPTVSIKANAPPAHTEMNHSVLNGTGIGHPGSGTGRIGGAAKYATGGINGTSFKHP